MTTQPRDARTQSISIQRPPADVHAFVADPLNLPRWAPGFCEAIGPDGDAWRVETPTGPARVRFVAPNALGVVDHWVTTPEGAEAYVPFRVVANGSGSEVLITMFRPPDTSNAQWETDAQLVAADLERLKAHLEDRAS